ncbi:cell division protein FtsB [Lachnospiraceae bacterium PF1-22]|uniref:hypothetical protein n=1 Tax=Ohessyouella blattaphilus TaxID=2949333 RepID=UPI003E26F5AF
MSGKNSKDIYDQLMDVMERLDSVEKSSKKNIRTLNTRIKHLEDENTDLKKTVVKLEKENHVLKTDNERLKRIINNDSSNSSLPPSTDLKGRAANTYNSRKKSGKKPGGRQGHKGTTLTKKDIEEKLKSGKFKHVIKMIGNRKGNYISKHVMDLEVVPIIQEVRIYADKNGEFSIPPEYKSDVTYGAGIKSLTVDLYSEGVMSNERIGIFLNTISENALSFCWKRLWFYNTIYIPLSA